MNHYLITRYTYARLYLLEETGLRLSASPECIYDKANNEYYMDGTFVHMPDQVEEMLHLTHVEYADLFHSDTHPDDVKDKVHSFYREEILKIVLSDHPIY